MNDSLRAFKVSRVTKIYLLLSNTQLQVALAVKVAKSVQKKHLKQTSTMPAVAASVKAADNKSF